MISLSCSGWCFSKCDLSSNVTLKYLKWRLVADLLFLVCADNAGVIVNPKGEMKGNYCFFFNVFLLNQSHQPWLVFPHVCDIDSMANGVNGTSLNFR